MTTYSHRVDALRSTLSTLDWTVSPVHVKRLSRDFHWFSPVLKRALEGKVADAVVTPRNEAELRNVVSACAREGVPLTVRGGGTGNYGQAVPLEGGVVIDMTSCDEFLWIRDGVARAQAGIRLAALEERLAPAGWELRCMPSTFRIATLGGLLCGGFGGIGSINYGPLAASGTILAVRIMTVEPEPRTLELRGSEALTFAHAYGTNGIVLEIELALAPVQQWDEYLLSFPDHASAFTCAKALADSPAIAKRNVALFSNQVQRYFGKLAEHLDVHAHAVIAAVAPSGREPLRALVTAHGGTLAWHQDGNAARSSQHTLLEYCWNHSTLHALRNEKAITYLQTAYTYGEERAQLEAIERAAPSEVMCHLEFIRDLQGRVVCVGLPLIRYTTDERLAELIALHRAHGVTINDPHVFTLEDGKHGGSLDARIVAAKRAYDPDNLLNPGKVRTLAA
ncbi:TPA: FAD-binding oxidoreductase [Burkholderia multivorans]|uniref:FAD-binding protein n=1 Tax=Burkholderia multivorans CGD2 TaxID=513052 RepID=B9BP28_9BURK|nr:FAD-binding oxidoreductase [Burkholderia multivorans]EEE07346.1 FAD-binding protein [Burkholderia multivorans CGD2]EEE13717.1 FAD-binding protein [Burkholderia multivorans CGD2M]PRH21106.1 FAD-binding oxidoreductase [Burkholderia multivorans]HEM7842884.1 FAD-binding oxidoreductase [Burkholderia multivorans]HEM7872724.1 FAD-binding oxidoreductase [Burkholderia multivorans]